VNELLVLGLLMHWPLHAYRLAKIANNILGPDDHLSRGTLSGLLAKLERAGLVTEAMSAQAPFPSDRPSRVLAITPAGRERFLRLMLDTPAHLDLKRLHIKALHLEFLPPEQQLFLVEHFLRACQHWLEDKQAEQHTFAADPLKQEHISSVFSQGVQAYMHLKIEQMQHEITWAQALHEQVLARLRSDALLADKQPPESR
jgi:DNA-binding PadR family transcriptional regulator